MKVLIVGLNYAPEKVGIAIYTTGLAEALVNAGHRVQVIAGQPYYPQWTIADGHSAWRFSKSLEKGVEVLRIPHFIPSKPSGAKRLLHHLTFGLAATIPVLKYALLGRPDLVVAIAPSLAGAPLARLAAKLTGAPAWLHIQDFEVEAALATGLLRQDGWLANWALNIERKILQSFDTVSSISPQMCTRLAAKGVPATRIVQFPNWADIGAIAPLVEPSPYRTEWAITTPHVAVYSGNIGNKQGIEIIIATARKLAGRKDLTFVICGDGPNREHLESLSKGLTNIQFRPLQPKERLNDLLGLASIHLLPQRASAADLVLPSKLGNMLASGRPIVATAAPTTGLAVAVDGCGLVVPPENNAAFSAAIERLLDDTSLHLSLGRQARQRAIEHWSATHILDAVIKQFVEAASPLTLSTLQPSGAS